MLQKNIIPPSEEALGTICHYLIRLQEVDSPLEKLENLLTAISAIFNSVSRFNSVSANYDDWGFNCESIGHKKNLYNFKMFYKKPLSE